MKWVYSIDPLDRLLGEELLTRRIYLEACNPEEAEIWTPFDHVKYFETEKAAKKKFGWWPSYYEGYLRHYNDPDYPIDWTEGDFS